MSAVADGGAQIFLNSRPRAVESVGLFSLGSMLGRTGRPFEHRVPAEPWTDPLGETIRLRLHSTAVLLHYPMPPNPVA